MDIFSISKTYQVDYTLFDELGLNLFVFDDQKMHFIGEYKFPHYEKASAKIYVTCMPAQFWKFEIQTDENKIYILETGSGTLSEYWKTVELVATGMLVLNGASGFSYP
jgi:hypothetical protein